MASLAFVVCFLFLITCNNTTFSSRSSNCFDFFFGVSQFATFHQSPGVVYVIPFSLIVSKFDTPLRIQGKIGFHILPPRNSEKKPHGGGWPGVGITGKVACMGRTGAFPGALKGAGKAGDGTVTPRREGRFAPRGRYPSPVTFQSSPDRLRTASSTLSTLPCVAVMSCSTLCLFHQRNDPSPSRWSCASRNHRPVSRVSYNAVLIALRSSCT